ncbi:MAG: hypothetical protein WD771_00660, partial [Gemmatimonadaceae bacterium]
PSVGGRRPAVPGAVAHGGADARHFHLVAAGAEWRPRSCAVTRREVPNARIVGQRKPTPKLSATHQQ